MATRIAILLVAIFVVVASSSPSYQRKMSSNAMDRVDRFDALLMSQLRRNGDDVAAIAGYFADSFTFTNFEGRVWDKREFLRVLQRHRLQHIFVPGDNEKVAYFRRGRGAEDLLIVRYYKDHVNYVLTLEEVNYLPAGYRFLHIRPASA